MNQTLPSTRETPVHFEGKFEGPGTKFFAALHCKIDGFHFFYFGKNTSPRLSNICVVSELSRLRMDPDGGCWEETDEENR